MRRRPLLVLPLLAVAAIVAVWLIGLGSPLPDDPPESVGGVKPEADDDPLAEDPTLQGRVETSGDRGDSARARTADGWGVRGRVLGSGRRPAAAARVAVWFDAARCGATTTDSDGRFRVASGDPLGEVPVAVFVRAEDAGGRVGMKNRTLTPARADDFDIGTLVLRHGYELRVLVETAAGPLADARVDLLGGGQVRQEFAGPALTDGSGIARFPGLPPEEFTVVAWADGYGPSSAVAGLPRLETDPVRVVLEPPRTLVVEVVEIVEGATERPLEGVEVGLVRRRIGLRRSSTARYHPPLLVEPTDAQGRTRIEGIGRDPALHVGVGARGFAVRMYLHAREEWRTSFRTFVPVPPNSDTLRIEIPAGRRVEWPVVAGDAPVPPDGAEIPFRQERWTRWVLGVEGGRMENGRLVVEGLLAAPFRATAVAPDGALAIASVGASGEEGPEISFSRPRAIDVEVRRADGTPASDAGVYLRGEPDQPLTRTVRTDVEGRVRIVGLHPISATVVAFPPRTESRAVDLSRGDTAVEVTLGEETAGPMEHPLLIHVRIGGAPALPDEYRLRTAGFEESGIRVRGEDPESGTLEAVWSAAPRRKSIEVELVAPGFTIARAGVAADTDAIALALEPAGSILFRERQDQERKPIGRWDTGILERSPDGGRTWEKVDGPRRCWRTAEAPVHGRAWWIDNLPAGLYRGRGHRSNITSDPVRVVPGREPAVLTLDLRTPAVVEGRVVLPRDATPDGGYVEVVEEGGTGRERELPLDEQGRFRLPWTPPAVAWIVTARHPRLRPHAERGRVRLADPVERVRLELTYGGEAVVRVDVEPIDGRVLAPPRAPRVLLLRDRADRVPVVRTPASIVVRDDGAWHLSFSGYEAGTYVVWADLSSRHAPLVLGPVQMDELDPDLGRVRLERGSRVRAVFANAAGAPSPEMLILRADAMAGPPLVRIDLVESGSEATVLGLGPGRYRVRGGPIRLDDEVPVDLDEVLEADGRSDYERVVNLGVGGR